MDAANDALAAAFRERAFSVELVSLPRYLGENGMADTELHYRVRPPAGRAVLFTEPVNVKYIAGVDKRANTHGVAAFAHTMLGGAAKVPATSNELWTQINTSLRVASIRHYHVPDSNYWFWSFHRDVDAAPITDFVVVSLLHATELESSFSAKTVGVNPAQSSPGIQYAFHVGARFQEQPISCLEGRDRLWHLMQPRIVAYEKETVTALECGY